MNISSSVGQAAMFGQLSTSNVSANPTTPLKSEVRKGEALVSDIEKDQPSNKQAKPSIVIDEQAIALFEQNKFEQSQVSEQSREQNTSSASQDQPSAKNETAVASYQAVGDLAQRESVQKLFGVDLFA